MAQEELKDRIMKTGRNAPCPCPCGSGRKFKVCCIDKSEILDLRESLQASMENQSFESLEEAQAHADAIMHTRNHQPRAEFEGLSPVQMGNLLGEDFYDNSVEVIKLAARTDASDTPVMQLFDVLCDAIREKGLKATATGNLPRQFCRDAALHLLG